MRELLNTFYGHSEHFNGRAVGDFTPNELGHDFPEVCLVLASNLAIPGTLAARGAGVVIGTRTVLTAAHLVLNREKAGLAFVRSVDQISDTSIEVSKTEIIKHNGIETDLALLITNEDLKRPIVPLAGSTDYHETREVTAVGYGSVSHPEGFNGWGDQNWISGMKVLSNDEMYGDSMETQYAYNSETQFVIASGACDLDSGGPVYSTADTERRLLGIISSKVSHQLGPSCKRDTICIRTDIITKDKINII